MLMRAQWDSLTQRVKSRSCKRSDTLVQKSLILFSTWREYFNSQSTHFSSQPKKDLNKDLLLLQDLGLNTFHSCWPLQRNVIGLSLGTDDIDPFWQCNVSLRVKTKDKTLENSFYYLDNWVNMSSRHNNTQDTTFQKIFHFLFINFKCTMRPEQTQIHSISRYELSKVCQLWCV